MAGREAGSGAEGDPACPPSSAVLPSELQTDGLVPAAADPSTPSQGEAALEEAVTPSWGRRVSHPHGDDPPTGLGLRVEIPPVDDGEQREGPARAGQGGAHGAGGSASHSPASIGSPVEEARGLQQKFAALAEQQAQPQQQTQHQQQTTEQQPAPERPEEPPASSSDGPGVATVLKKIQKWGHYDDYGDVVAGSRVIPMKTPLTLDLQKGYIPLSPDVPVKPFTLPSFLADQQALGRHVGLVIDLSNHACLYTEDLPPPDRGLQYRHFQFVAKRLPDPQSCRRVCEAITEFVEQHPDQYVAIHCSYGFNRTGFVLCVYLIEELGMTADQALQAFARSRPPGVKHEDFVEELRARYPAVADSSSRAEEAAPSEGDGQQQGLPKEKEGGGRWQEQPFPLSPNPTVEQAGGSALGGGQEEEGEGEAALQRQLSSISTSSTNRGWRRGHTPRLLVEQRNFNDINNDSLGIVSGQDIIAELERELQAQLLSSSAAANGGQIKATAPSPTSGGGGGRQVQNCRIT